MNELKSLVEKMNPIDRYLFLWKARGMFMAEYPQYIAYYATLALGFFFSLAAIIIDDMVLYLVSHWNNAQNQRSR